MALRIAGIEFESVKDAEAVLKAIEVLRAELENLSDRTESQIERLEKLEQSFQSLSKLSELSKQLEEMQKALPKDVVAKEVAQAKERIDVLRREVQEAIVRVSEDSLKILEGHRQAIAGALDVLIQKTEERARKVQELLFRFSFFPLFASALAGILFLLTVVLGSVKVLDPQVIVKGGQTYVVMKVPIKLGIRER